MPPIPDHLIWYAIFWALLMSPFYIAAAWLCIFLWRALGFMKERN